MRKSSKPRMLNLKVSFFSIVLSLGLSAFSSATEVKYVDSELDGIVELKKFTQAERKIRIYIVASSITSIELEEQESLSMIRMATSEVSPNSTKSGTGTSYWLYFEDAKATKEALEAILAEIKLKSN